MAAPAPALDLAHLRAFHAVVKAGGFSAAAERLHRTQSAVSHAVSRLERSAKVRLLDRRGRKVVPTPEGEILREACERVFATLEEAEEALQRERKRAEGRLRLGATVEFGTSVLMRHIRPFLDANPGIEMDFHLSHDLLTPLLRDDVDLAIDCVTHPNPEIERTPLFREAYMVACAPDYREAHRIEDPADLSRCAVLSIDKECAWWERFLGAFPKSRRPSFGRVVAINHIRGLITAAASGLGVLLAPSYSLKGELDRGALVPLFPTIRPLEDRFALYQKAGKARLARHRLLTEYLQEMAPAEFGA
ncbi:MAG: LysR family transcriptional regulator [Thermoanaerobaculia bacterium]|jgi:DNA-binding transcriptional LysR family regulator|nr:LysR family transcriptional regulator [Thermoanaerobaculia bacterium]